MYISGNELFDMADIRAAFETVRATLSLDKETVLFGVPVDNDDALATNAEDVTIVKVDEKINIQDTVDADNCAETTMVPDEPEPLTITKKVKTTRGSHPKVVPVPMDDESGSLSPQIEPEDTQPESAVPILSVLGGNVETESVIEANMPDIQENTTVAIEDEDTPDTEKVSIGDMLADDAVPVETSEKTLEALLESMTPLGEDENTEEQIIKETIVEEDTGRQATDNNDDTDVTLELLATEFAESADKMVVQKTENKGKIGKLKNILPFKKAKRDDSGIMGDLFGWAGVANDEDFTIPGFFANAKK